MHSVSERREEPQSICSKLTTETDVSNRPSLRCGNGVSGRYVKGSRPPGGISPGTA
jgi:hypothetical protein